jgi:2'-5' RNA ligase
MEPVRAFVAIELPDTVKSALAGLQDYIKQRERAPVKWVDSERIHLTLKFLGNIDAASIPQLSEAISEAAREITPFRLETGKPGGFPNLRAPRVLWIGLRCDTDSLTVLQKNIESALVPLGFPREKKAFLPHLTFGRVRDQASANDLHRLGEITASIELDSPLSFAVNSFNLMRSVLTREGPIYTRLYTITLQGG